MINLDEIILGSGIADLNEVDRLHDRVLERSGSVCVKNAALQASLDSSEEQLAESARADMLDDSMLGTRERNTLQAAAAHKVAKEVGKLRDEILDKTAKERQDHLRYLHESVATLQVVAKTFPTPVAYLSAQGLGTEQRSRFLDQVRGAGPAELATYGKLAASKGDRVLAAAVLSRLDSLPRDSRPFTAQGFAELMVGDEHAAIIGKVRDAKAAFQRAINANRSLETGKPLNPTSKIAAGLNSLAAKAADSRAAVGRAMRGGGS